MPQKKAQAKAPKKKAPTVPAAAILDFSQTLEGEGHTNQSIGAVRLPGGVVRPLFKVLNKVGQSRNGGLSMNWSLPTDDKPGQWHEAPKQTEQGIVRAIKRCSWGLHLTPYPTRWGLDDAKASDVRVFLAEGRRAYDGDGSKIAFRQARLVRELTAQECAALYRLSVTETKQLQPTDQNLFVDQYVRRTLAKRGLRTPKDKNGYYARSTRSTRDAIKEIVSDMRWCKRELKRLAAERRREEKRMKQITAFLAKERALMPQARKAYKAYLADFKAKQHKGKRPTDVWTVLKLPKPA